MGDIGRAAKKAEGDLRNEGGREVNRWKQNPGQQFYDYASFAAAPIMPIGLLGNSRFRSLADPHQQARIIRQGDKGAAKKYRSEQRMARNEANAQGLRNRQQAVASGLGGGGSQVSSEIDGFNSVLAAYAAQRAQSEQASAQGRNQSLASLLSLIALL